MCIKEGVIGLNGGYHIALILKTLIENLNFQHGRKESTLSEHFGVEERRGGWGRSPYIE
jgi:hypothetical protein